MPRPLAPVRAALAAVLLPLLVSTGPASAAAPATPPHPVAPPAAPAAAAPRPLKHPGAFMDRARLDFVRAQVRAGAEPYASAFDAMRASRYASLGYYVQPQTTVICPPGNRPGKGCVEERENAIAAYTHALMWAITRDETHARKAMEIMDLWSGAVRDHTEGNSGLQSAWAGSMWARAGEIMRHVYGDWPEGRVARFERMLREVYLPQVAGGSLGRNGNWDLVMADAAANIGVFLDDRAVLERAVARVRQRVPAYFYLRSDGPRPESPPGGMVDSEQELTRYWFGQERYVDGLAQETCRNFEHVGYAIAATAHVAETARLQGIDLYGDIAERLRATLEFHSRFQVDERENVPQWLCGGRLTLTMGPDLEAALNHLQNRLGLKLPHARRLAGEMRPAGTDHLFVAWETLTHGGEPVKAADGGEPARAARGGEPARGEEPVK